MTSAAGDAFPDAQGDIGDTRWDMFCAVVAWRSCHPHARARSIDVQARRQRMMSTTASAQSDDAESDPKVGRFNAAFGVDGSTAGGAAAFGANLVQVCLNFVRKSCKGLTPPTRV